MYLYVRKNRDTARPPRPDIHCVSAGDKDWDGMGKNACSLLFGIQVNNESTFKWMVNQLGES